MSLRRVSPAPVQRQTRSGVVKRFKKAINVAEKPRVQDLGLHMQTFPHFLQNKSGSQWRSNRVFPARVIECESCCHVLERGREVRGFGAQKHEENTRQ